MKTFTILLCLILLSSRLLSQELKEEEFLGTWKVINCSIIPEFEKELDGTAKTKMEQMGKGFVGSIFYFGADHKFAISFTKNTPSFMKELELPVEAKWKIEKGKSILIGTKKDGYTLMGIIIESKQEKKYFILDDTPYILEVIEQKDK